MSLYRKRDTGELKTVSEIKKENTNVSLPKEWNENVYDALAIDPVAMTTPPSTTTMQVAEMNGAEQNSEGNWQVAWSITDRFSDDENGTKAEKEAAYQVELDEDASYTNKQDRNRLLTETDWWAMPDSPTMTAEQTAYRQALRDITTHANWPHLSEDDWPTKP